MDEKLLVHPLTSVYAEPYFSMSAEFFSSTAVSHPVPHSHMEATLAALDAGTPLLKGYVLELTPFYTNSTQPAHSIIGYSLLTYTWCNEVGGVEAWIDEIYIAPAMRGHGFGKFFLSYLMSHNIENIKSFRLEVIQGNASAQKLYESLGFRTSPYTQMTCDPAPYLYPTESAQMFVTLPPPL